LQLSVAFEFVLLTHYYLNKTRNDRQVRIKNIRQIATKPAFKIPKERLICGCYMQVGEQCTVLAREIETLVERNSGGSQSNPLDRSCKHKIVDSVKKINKNFWNIVE